MTAEAQFRTVLGDVTPLPGGHILMHEHTLCGWWGSEYDAKAQIDLDAAVAAVASELASVRERHGVVALVDASPPELGRNVEWQRELARRSGVHIIASTGFYKESLGIPFYWRMLDVDDYADWMCGELRDGALGSEGRCGVIKAASSGGKITDAEGRALRAAAAAAAATGAAIITHTDPEGWSEAVGVAQLELFLDEGVAADRVAIGHVCGSGSIEPLLEICAAGAYVAFDRIGSGYVRPDEMRADMIAALCEAGYRQHVLLSHDHQGAWIRRRVPDSVPPVKKSYSLLYETMLPMLAERGLGAEDFDVLMSANPTRLLALSVASVG